MRKKQIRKDAYQHQPDAVPGNPGWAGQWRSHYAAPGPLVLELGCGKGEFSLGYAALHPECNIVAVDVKHERLWAGSIAAQERGIGNIRWLREDISLLDELFAPGEASEIWLTFPDPYPKDRHARRRLTSPEFLARYRRALAPGGALHLKTDNAGLYAWTLEVLAGLDLQPEAATADLYASGLQTPENSLKTTFERRFQEQGLPTHYLRLRFPA